MTATKTPTTKTKPKTVKVATLNLPNNPFAFEVFDLASRQRSAAKKVEVLKKYEHVSLKSLFIWNFDESVVSVLPEGEVPYVGYADQNTYSGSLSTKISEEDRKMHEMSNFSLGVSDDQGRTTIRREFKNFYHLKSFFICFWIIGALFDFNKLCILFYINAVTSTKQCYCIVLKNIHRFY